MNIVYKARLLACLLILLSLPSIARGGGGPENVLLIVNANSDSSKMIANWYIDGRGIPSQNVVYLDRVPMRERIQLADFTERILRPIFAAMSERKLTRSIDYIVYSSDFPTAIPIHSHRKALLKLDEKIPQQFFKPEASISSLTYFALSVLNDSPTYMAFTANNYYRKPVKLVLTNPFSGQRQVEFQEVIKAFDFGTSKQLQDSIDKLVEMLKKNPRQVALTYWLAKFHAKNGDFKMAAKWLQRSIQLGWRFRRETLSDPVFKLALNDPLFKGFADRIPNDPFFYIPARGFKRGYGFAPNGFLNDELGQGNNHFLSTVLAVTRNLGTTEEEALRQLKASMAADGTHPRGTFYFSDNGDVRTKTRKPHYVVSIDELEAMGHKTKIIKEDLPVKADDIVGLSCGKSSFNFKNSGSKIVPGAICENLTSWGGIMAGKAHSGISELIRYGAAGSSGTVIEPYSIQAKFPHPMIQVHYAKGCSLAEAFYQSVSGPFQLLIVGDALCQPWASKPEFTVEGLRSGETISGKREVRINVSKSSASIRILELYIDGLLVGRSRFKETVKFDTAALTEGFHEARFVLTAEGPIETVGNQVIPFQVDNFGMQTTLTTDATSFGMSKRITFKAKSNFGNAIELFQNSRSLGRKDGPKAEFTVSASKLGRGPVKLVAVAISDKGNRVASKPLEFEVTGPISTVKINTEPKPKPKPKSKPKSKPKPELVK